jgi:hypothetical protein
MERSVDQKRAIGKNYKHMATHVKSIHFSQLRVPLQPSEPGLVTSFVIGGGSSGSIMT